MAWLTEEKTRLHKVQHEKNHCKKQREELPDPVLADNIEQKLWAGLNLLKELAIALHKAVTSINPEPGCDCELGMSLADTSLLYSTPFELVPCSAAGKQGCGNDLAVRFPEDLRLKVPPKEAAGESGRSSALLDPNPH